MLGVDRRHLGIRTGGADHHGEAFAGNGRRTSLEHRGETGIVFQTVTQAGNQRQGFSASAVDDGTEIMDRIIPR